jgi:hypothetical protein
VFSPLEFFESAFLGEVDFQHFWFYFFHCWIYHVGKKKRLPVGDWRLQTANHRLFHNRQPSMRLAEVVGVFH